MMIWNTGECLLVKLCIILTSSLTYSTYAIEPLIFNPYTRDVFNVRAMSSHKSNPSVYVAACPSVENEHETNFNRKYSLDRKSLVVRGELHETYDEVEKIQCKKGFELSIAEYYGTSRAWSELQIGYEISKITKSGFKKFFSKIFKTHSPRLRLNKKQKMGFVWLTKIRLEYGIESWSLKKVTHEIHRHADQLQQKVECHDYDLGNKLYGFGSLDKYYYKTVQKTTLKQFELPKLTLPSGDCRMKRRCFEKYNFVQPYMFQSSPSAPVSCTDLTTVPIWHEVSKPLLDQLDKFLIAMAQCTERRLTIISGVHRILALPTIDGNELKDVYLDPEWSSIPVSKIIYKIVRYKSYQCNSEKETCLYEILIVIHNEPDFNDDDKLCLEDKCSEWGWRKIQQYYNKSVNRWRVSEYIYCCKLDDKLKNKLDMSPENLKYEDLDLRKFPYYDENNNEQVVVDRQDEFERVMDQLFPIDGSSVDWDSIPNLKFQGKYD